jgi:serine/threonine protein kinase
VLEAGTRLGPYEIVAFVADGGMGEVYRARDSRLDREIALKILPPHLIGVDSRRRFQQEARSASALTHPNIVTIHDVGEADGIA